MLFDTGWMQIIQVTTEPMLFSIDIAFLAEPLIITEVYRNVEPGYIVTSTLPARYILEVNAGELEGIDAGDSASVELLFEPPVQPWPPPVIDWPTVMAGFMGFVMMMVFIATTIRILEDALMPPKEKPRGERLLPQTEKTKYEEIAYELLEDPEFWFDVYRVKDLTGLSYANASRVMEVLRDKGFLAKARAFYEGMRYPPRSALENIRAIEEVIGKGYKGKRLPQPQSLPRTAPVIDRLDGLGITKAFKQISRHREDQITVSLQAWAIFPKGKRPHMISFYRDGDYYVVHPLYAHIKEWVRIPVGKMHAWIKSLPLRHFEPMAVAPKDRERAEQLAREVETQIDILDLYPGQRFAPSTRRDPILGEVTLGRIESLFRQFVDEEHWFVAALREGSIDSWNFNLFVWPELPHLLFATRENEEGAVLGPPGDFWHWQVIDTYEGISLIKASAIQKPKRLWYLGEWWEEEYSTADAVVYRSADGKKRLYVYWDGTKEVKPVPDGEGLSSSKPPTVISVEPMAMTIYDVLNQIPPQKTVRILTVDGLFTIERKYVDYPPGKGGIWIKGKWFREGAVLSIEDEQRNILWEWKQPGPRVIPIEPRPRRPREEIEFLPDSPEVIAQTIDAIGYREQIDSAFMEAIKRAKGLI